MNSPVSMPKTSKNFILLGNKYFSPIKTFLIFSLFLILVFSDFQVFAQNTENLEEVCQYERIDKECEVISREDCQNLLEICLKYYEQKSTQLQESIDVTKQKEKTYENQIYVLKNKINKLKAQIGHSNLIIKDLGFQIRDTEGSIEKTTVEIEDSRQKIAYILRLSLIHI